jgi:hypothetical protein
MARTKQTVGARDVAVSCLSLCRLRSVSLLVNLHTATPQARKTTGPPGKVCKKVGRKGSSPMSLSQRQAMQNSQTPKRRRKPGVGAIKYAASTNFSMCSSMRAVHPLPVWPISYA